MSHLEGFEKLPPELREFVLSPDSLKNILAEARRLAERTKKAIYVAKKPVHMNTQEAERATKQEIVRDYVRETIWSIFEGMIQPQKRFRVSEIKTELRSCIQRSLNEVKVDVDVDAHHEGVEQGIRHMYVTLQLAIVREFLHMNPDVEAELTKDCANGYEKAKLRHETFGVPLMSFLADMDPFSNQ